MDYVSAKNLRIPLVTTEEMRKVDRLMIEKYGIELVQMMENAGRNLADLGRETLESSVIEKHIVVVAGKGNNGGGGLTAARHLNNWGAKVTVLLEKEPFSNAPKIQWQTLKHLPIERKFGKDAIDFLGGCQCDLVIDALIGYSLSGNPRDWAKEAIRAINAHDVPIIALDIPSGLDATTGKIYTPCIKADSTLTLALPKKGLLNSLARRVVGTIYLADISVPSALYKEMGINIGPIFLSDTIIRLRD